MNAAQNEPLPPKTSLAPAVTVVEAVMRELVDTAVVTGNLVPRDEILVTPEIDGQRITELLVEEGMAVERGQVLARLSRDLIDRQLAQQNALVDKAAAAVPQAQNNIEQSEAADVEARLSLERALQLMKTGNSTASVIETRTSAAKQAEGRLAFARNGLDIAKADLAQAIAVRDEINLRLARTEIRAPEAGVVNRRTARVGMLASSSSEPLFRLIARGEIELEGEVIESKLPLMRQGEPAWIETEDGDRVQGVVRTSYPEVDKASRLGKVRVSLFPDPRFRIGSFARGGIEVARARAVTIPQASVLYGDDRRTTVLVVGPGDKVEARDVRIGMTNDSEVQVRSGLALGERVVARAGSFLRDGDRIRPIMIAAKEAAVSVAPTTTSVARNP
ncbi:MAG: efflux RND transporter periplasmic adaptor subunit [Beijerinckiaceae bacterium]